MKRNNYICVKIQRHDPFDGSKPFRQTYEVPYEEGLTVLRILNYIYEELDHTLAFRYSCRITFCGICGVRVNGKNALACKRIVKPGESLIIEPLKGYKLIRDLVVHFEEKIS